jgi:hypothetical protein
VSHHYSGVDFGFPHGDPRLDFCDLYAFPTPGDARHSIVIMTVHPASILSLQGPTTSEPFAPEAIYELKIDRDGDAVADTAYRFRFSPSGNGAQTATVRRVAGADAAGRGDGGETIFEGAPVSMGADAYVTQAGDYRLFAGWRSDPFFFDTNGALNGLQFTGDDFFAEADVCCIVLELPNREFAEGGVALWHRSLIPGDDEGWVQVERGARTQQVPFLIPNEEKAAYASSEPADDDRFVAGLAHSLEHTGGYAPEEAERLARTMVPDVLRYDPTRPVAYPDNGRGLTEDVVDPFLATLTNGKIKEDGVDPHTDLLSEFPYVGPPHETRVTA